MAVFANPSSAVQAMLQSQTALKRQDPEIVLRAGIHHGPCIGVNQNERIDYFGATVNIATRLEGYSTGDDVVVSEAVYDDPDVQSLIGANEAFQSVEQISTDELKDLKGRSFIFGRSVRQYKPARIDQILFFPIPDFAYIQNPICCFFIPN